jgi:tetratricopeptide (TPR) repeat protein
MRDLNVGDMLASALLRRVDATKHAADWPEAERLLHQALAANPRNATALRLMGDANVLQGRFAAAVPYFERGLAIRADPIAARGLGFAKLQLGDVEAAIVQYRAALAADPGDAEAHNLLGTALAAQKQLDAALPHFERAVRLRPDYAEAAENLRRTRAALGRP